MHWCTEVHESLSILTDLIHANSVRYVELGRSQKKHDNTDLQKLLLWFNCHEPFNLSEFRLKCLSTGWLRLSSGWLCDESVYISDDINCDKAEAVGEAIQSALDNICMEDVVIPKRLKCPSFSSWNQVLRLIPRQFILIF